MSPEALQYLQLAKSLETARATSSWTYRVKLLLR